MNDYDPTGYYRRKARKNAEMLDVLIPFYKWSVILCLIYLVLSRLLD